MVYKKILGEHYNFVDTYMFQREEKRQKIYNRPNVYNEIVYFYKPLSK